MREARAHSTLSCEQCTLAQWMKLLRNGQAEPEDATDIRRAPEWEMPQHAEASTRSSIEALGARNGAEQRRRRRRDEATASGFPPCCRTNADLLENVCRYLDMASASRCDASACRSHGYRAAQVHEPAPDRLRAPPRTFRTVACRTARRSAE